MYEDERVAGSWPALVDRLESRATLDRWSHHEVALTGLNAVADIVALTEPGQDKNRADEVLAALVRLAAIDGGDEADAVLLLLHLLSPGVAAMAAKYADLAPDIVAVIVGELAATIRSFPWRRRHRAVAANLLLDTRSAVVRELLPRRTRKDPRVRELLIAPGGRMQPLLDSRVAPPGESGDLSLGEVLAWAADTGVASREDLALLVELEECREYVRAPRLYVAARHGISEKTVRRRRDRALAALRLASNAYLANVA